VGQKTHPTGFRTGINKSHASTWFANYGAYSQVLKEDFEIRKLFEKEFVKFLKENNIELDGEISEEVVGFGEILPKGEYILKQDILNKEEEELTAKKGDKVIAFEDEAPVDTVLGADIFAVIHDKTKEKIYVSLEDIKSA